MSFSNTKCRIASPPPDLQTEIEQMYEDWNETISDVGWSDPIPEGRGFDDYVDEHASKRLKKYFAEVATVIASGIDA